MGLRRQKNYAGRWDILIQQATQCLNRLIEIAARKRRNYILDQVVLPDAHAAQILATVSQCAPVITLSNGLFIYLSGRSVYYRIEEALINPLVTCLLCTVKERCLMVSLSDIYFVVGAYLHLLFFMS